MTDFPSNNLKWFSSIAKYVILLLFSGAFIYKLIITPFQLNIDFLALLSLAIALFSVGLSAMFYFKATETSNAFYDNTFKYTKEIAELLVRIESGFGERLKHLDESYTHIQDKVMSSTVNEDLGKAQEKIAERERELQQKLQERDALIDELSKTAKLEGKKKDEFFEELKKKDLELDVARNEIEDLRLRFSNLEQFPDGISREKLDQMVSSYLAKNILPLLNIPTNGTLPASILNHRWIVNLEKMDLKFKRDMHRLGYIDNDGSLTLKGFSLMRTIIKNNTEKEEIPF